MTDIVERLRKHQTPLGPTMEEAADEIERWKKAHKILSEQTLEDGKEIELLRLWLRRIENINDDPKTYNPEIDEAVTDAWIGKPMTGKINAGALPGQKEI